MDVCTVSVITSLSSITPFCEAVIVDEVLKLFLLLLIFGETLGIGHLRIGDTSHGTIARLGDAQFIDLVGDSSHLSETDMHAGSSRTASEFGKEQLSCTILLSDSLLSNILAKDLRVLSWTCSPWIPHQGC